MRSGSRYLWIVGLCLSLCLVLKFLTWNLVHDELDEVIYWQLSENLYKNGHYSLQGTTVLPYVSTIVYDRPLFHHPPLLALLLGPFVLWSTPQFGVLVSWAGHLLCIAAVAIVCRAYAQSSRRPVRFLLYAPVIGVALDPFLTFISTKIWTDSLLAGLTSMALALFIVAGEVPKPRRFWIGGGVLLGLAALVKVIALALLPFVAYLLVAAAGRQKRKWIEPLCWGILPTLLLVLPWFIVFYRTFGSISPSWIKADEWTIHNYKFAHAAMNRPVFYYLIKMSFIQPMFLVCFAAAIFRSGIMNDANFRNGFIWCLLYLVVITFLSATGQGFQTRYLAPMYPGVYVMWSGFIRHFHSRPRMLWTTGALSIACSSLTGLVYLWRPVYDELISLPEHLHLLG